MQRVTLQSAQRAVAVWPAGFLISTPLSARQCARSFVTGAPRSSDTALSNDTTILPPSTSDSGQSHPYYVGRSASKNLSVYHRTRSGGSNRTTEIKKVEGDARVLSQQLQDALNVETKINPRTNTIIVKGFHKQTITAWLEGRGF